MKFLYLEIFHKGNIICQDRSDSRDGRIFWIQIIVHLKYFLHIITDLHQCTTFVMQIHVDLMFHHFAGFVTAI